MSARPLPAYLPAPAVGSLVYVPGTTFAPRRSCYCCRGYVGQIGIVRSVQRDIRTGRVLTVACSWFDLDFRPLGSGPVGVGHVLPWSPRVGCGADCAPVVGFGASCAGCGY